MILYSRYSSWIPNTRKQYLFDGKMNNEHLRPHTFMTGYKAKRDCHQQCLQSHQPNFAGKTKPGWCLPVGNLLMLNYPVCDLAYEVSKDFHTLRA